MMPYMKHLYLLLLFTVQFLTAQNYHPDKIIIDGITYDYRYHHLEVYFNHYPEKRPVINKDSTIISRGYIAEYEIKDQVLYLKDIKIPVDGDYKQLVSNTNTVFQDNKTMKMYWVNGLYDVGLGDPIITSPADTLNPVFNNYYIFEIERGTIIRTNNFTYKQYKRFKDYQWERFRYSEDYTKLYKKMLRTGIPEEDIENHIYYHILFYSKRNFLKK
ncbi:hypothetical protein QW060_11535 [Myroides ceti]|uniref:Uncharacterized protein n=1 Tax=Paenimyroides ceti TaxID=395087 RepID=A0ABT8CTA5_9FLAO|nr:hypothetical protein [Paenimyroides ceti]MDN3707747.1 hypothetical protein [Paenimyroides ceti]